MNNKNKQVGKVSKLMLMIIIGGISFGAYYANKKGLVSAKSFSSIASIAKKVSGKISGGNSSSHSGYGIQLMATKHLDQAKSLMNDFAKDGYSAFVIAAKNRNGQTLYKVRLGPYSHKPEATAIKDKVVRRYPENPYVKASLVIYRPSS